MPSNCFHRDLKISRRGSFLVLTSILSLSSVGATFQAASANQTLSGAITAQVEALQKEKESRTPIQRKIESNLLYAIKASRRDPLFAQLPNFKPAVKPDQSGRVKIVINSISPVVPALLEKVKTIGVQLLGSSQAYNRIVALVPLDRIEAIASLTEVRSIQPYIPPVVNVGSSTSEGDGRHLANVSRSNYGVTGSGIKIGIISDSYNNLGGAASDISKGDLPRDGVTLVGSGDLPSGGSDEGRAMAQIIHDIAPGAKLYFATGYGGEQTFADNIKALAAAGCKIIVDDLFYFTEPVFQDGIVAQAVNTVTANGVLFFSSAGNAGNKNDGTSGVWEGNFVDSGAVAGKGTVHSFPSAGIQNTITGNGLLVTLQWSDPYYASTNDYDLYIADPSGTQVVAASTNYQDGVNYPYPFEYVDAQPANNKIFVTRANGSQARYLHVNTNRGTLADNTRGQIWGHTAATRAFSVGASSAYQQRNSFTGGAANPVETFSSDGPRKIFFNADGSPVTPGNFLSTGGTSRKKPDLVAADGVMTTFPAYPNSYFNPFYGTSAAAPHAAAIAALLKQYKPSLTASQLRSLLTSTALDIEAPGYDPDSGYGILMADRVLQKASQMP